jgi:transcriptional regulator of arginine metabolism
MKTDRQGIIRELLVNTSVTSQDELRRKLASRGFKVTQATLSRDIRELKLLKGPAGYALPETGEGDPVDALPAIAEILTTFAVEIRQAQNQLVLLTVKGAASPVAAVIDDEDYTEVLGTIAGDNTVLIVCADHRAADAVRARLEAYFE